MDLCHTSEPTTYAEATSTKSCANVTVTDTDFALADGDVSGRKITFNGKTGGSGTANETGLYLAFTDGVSELLAVTQCGSQAVTSGATVDFNAYDVHELRDPVSES